MSSSTAPTRMPAMCAATTRSTRRSPSRPRRFWGSPASRRRDSYSDTYELELHGRTWRCRWCHRSGKDLMQECTGERPQIKAKFVFRALSKKGIKKARGRKFWGRKRAPRRAGAHQRRTGVHSAAHGPLQRVWASHPPPVSPPHTKSAPLQTRAATVQGEHHAHLLKRPPERGGGH